MKMDMKHVKSLYGINSFTDSATYAKTHFKDAGGVILARNLEYVSTEIFTQEYAGLTFLNQGVVVNNEGGYSTSIQKLKLKTEGDFRESGDNTDTTGKITLTGETDSIPVYSLEASSDWSTIELERANLQNINLPSRFLEGHAERYNQKIDNIGYLGQKRTNGTFKTTGLLNFGWDTTAAADTAENLTGQELYDEIAQAITRQWTGVLNVETYKADRVTFPSRVYNVATTKILNSNGTDKSVLAALNTNFPTVTFGMTTKSDTVANGGQLAASTTVIFSSNRKAMQFRLPVPLNVSSIDRFGNRFYVESFFGIAGLDVIEEDSAQTLTGL